jgi:hypothetical protein
MLCMRNNFDFLKIIPIALQWGDGFQPESLLVTKPIREPKGHMFTVSARVRLAAFAAQYLYVSSETYRIVERFRVSHGVTRLSCNSGYICHWHNASDCQPLLDNDTSAQHVMHSCSKEWPSLQCQGAELALYLPSPVGSFDIVGLHMDPAR